MTLTDFSGFARSILPTRMLPSVLIGGAVGYPLYVLFVYVMTNHYPDRDITSIPPLAFICPCFLVTWYISVRLGIFGMRDELQSHFDALGYLAKKANLTDEEYAAVHRRMMDKLVDMTSPAYKASLQNQSGKPEGVD